MTEIINNSALASWVQAIIYLLTLIVITIQLSHLRKQTKTQIDTLKSQLDNSKYTDYIRCQSDFTQTMRQLLNNNLHDEIYDNLSKKGNTKFNSDWKSYDSEDKKVYAFFEILYELFERVFVIKENDNDNKIIDEQEWKYWESWIDDIIEHPVFNDVHVDNLGMFDQKFESIITEKLIKANNYNNNFEKISKKNLA